MATVVSPSTKNHPEVPLSELPVAAPVRSWRPVHLLAFALIAMLVSAVALARVIDVPSETRTLLTHTVTRGDLLVTVVEEGTLESSKNTEIKCTVRGGYGGRGGESTVTWVIPEGSVVKPGDELVRLDTKIIEETVSLGKTDTNIAKAALARSKADLAKAEIAVDAYLKGRYRSQMKSLEMQLAIAKRNLRTSQTMYRTAEGLFKQGNISELELEGNGYAVTQAQLEVNVKETEIDVLSRLTKAMELETLNGQLTATRARLEGRKAGLELEQGRLNLALEELENCVVRAQKGGLVIYPSTAKWKDTPDITVGASVRNNQVLLLMPDLAQMQVKIGIHESIIDRFTPGLPAIVRLPTRTFDSQISSVASVASPAGWWSGNEVNYDAIVRLPAEERLNPGMSAQVEVVVARHADVLSVPVSAVVETDQGHFCWVETASGMQRRSLQLGDNNEEFIVVESGLTENEKVALQPLDSVEEARQMVAPTIAHTIRRGDLVVSLTEQGTLESSNNTNVKCRVRGTSTVNWVIESGTMVEEGDVLVTLENKQIEDFLHERTKFAYLSKDAAIGFRAHATRAGLAISEYLEGRYRTQLMTLEKDLAIAEEQLRTARSMLSHAQLMLERGYISELEVEQKEFAVKEAKLDVEIKQTDIDVLKRFTKAQELATLRGDWESAKAAAKGHEEVLKMDEARIALARKEIERSTIRAPRSGLVIYPMGAEWKDEPEIAEGTSVHNDQVLLLMPDLSQMQVKVGIYESMVDSIQPGMTAKVTLPDRVLHGQVVKVSSAAQPASWWSGNIVKYDAIIELPPVNGLKPGMNAEVELLIDSHRDVLKIPIAAVVENEQGAWCWVGTPDQATKRSIQLGDSGDTFIIAESGLSEGEQVVLNPANYFEAAQIPAEVPERPIAGAHPLGSVTPNH